MVRLDLKFHTQVIEDLCHEIAAAFEALPAESRAAMLALIGDRLFQVGTDAERGFSVEGIFELSLMHEPHRSSHASEGALLVAGGCYDRVCPLPVPLTLPVAGQVAAQTARV